MGCGASRPAEEPEHRDAETQTVETPCKSAEATIAPQKEAHSRSTRDASTSTLSESQMLARKTEEQPSLLWQHAQLPYSDAHVQCVAETHDKGTDVPTELPKASSIERGTTGNEANPSAQPNMRRGGEATSLSTFQNDENAVGTRSSAYVWRKRLRRRQQQQQQQHADDDSFQSSPQSLSQGCYPADERQDSSRQLAGEPIASGVHDNSSGLDSEEHTSRGGQEVHDAPQFEKQLQMVGQDIHARVEAAKQHIEGRHVDRHMVPTSERYQQSPKSTRSNHLSEVHCNIEERIKRAKSLPNAA